MDEDIRPHKRKRTDDGESSACYCAANVEENLTKAHNKTRQFNQIQSVSKTESCVWKKYDSLDLQFCTKEGDNLKQGQEFVDQRNYVPVKSNKQNLSQLQCGSNLSQLQCGSNDNGTDLQNDIQQSTCYSQIASDLDHGKTSGDLDHHKTFSDSDHGKTASDSDHGKTSSDSDHGKTASDSESDDGFVVNPGFEILFSPREVIPNNTNCCSIDNENGEHCPYVSTKDIVNHGNNGNDETILQDSDGSLPQDANYGERTVDTNCDLNTSQRVKIDTKSGSLPTSPCLSLVSPILAANSQNDVNEPVSETTSKFSIRSCLNQAVGYVRGSTLNSNDSNDKSNGDIKLDFDILHDVSGMKVIRSDSHVGNINELPPALLLKIFGYLRMWDVLKRVSPVCKYWYRLAHDPDLWRCVDLHYQQKVTDQIFLRLTGISDRVTEINISDMLSVSTDGIIRVLEQCQHLLALHTCRCYSVTDEVLICLSRRCRRLRTLVLDGCYKVSDDGLNELSSQCMDLRKLHIGRCSKVTDRSITQLARNCKQLTEIALGYLTEITDISVEALCQMCPNLEVVVLMFSGVGEKGVRALTQLRNLKTLDISNLPGLTSAVVATLTFHCPDLEVLNVSLNPQIDDDCLLQIIKYGRRLHLLHCVSCDITDRMLEELGKYTTTLSTLDIGWCKAVTDHGIRSVSANCKSLRYLGLIRCDSITADTVEELVAAFPHITYSTFILESRKLIERARREGFRFDDDDSGVDILI